MSLDPSSLQILISRLTGVAEIVGCLILPLILSLPLPALTLALALLAVLVLWLGIYPSSFTHVFDAPVNAMVQAHLAALTPHTALALVTTK